MTIAIISIKITEKQLTHKLICYEILSDVNGAEPLCDFPSVRLNVFLLLI